MRGNESQGGREGGKGGEAEERNKGEAANSWEDPGIKNLQGKIRSLYSSRQHCGTEN